MTTKDTLNLNGNMYDARRLAESFRAVDLLNEWIRSVTFKALDHPNIADQLLTNRVYQLKAAAIRLAERCEIARFVMVHTVVTCRCQNPLPVGGYRGQPFRECYSCNDTGKKRLNFLQTTIPLPGELPPLKWLTPEQKIDQVCLDSRTRYRELPRNEEPIELPQYGAASSPAAVAQALLDAEQFAQIDSQSYRELWPWLWVGESTPGRCVVCGLADHLDHRTFVEPFTPFYWTATICGACTQLAESLPVPRELMKPPAVRQYADRVAMRPMAEEVGLNVEREITRRIVGTTA